MTTTDFLSGGGEMGELIKVFDWSRTPLGPIEDWPTSLKTTIALTLLSPVPIVSLWGEQGTMIYNDAYSVVAGARHPTLLGKAVREGWPEVADFNDNVMKVGLAGGVLSYRDQELTLYRSGVAEQVFLNLDYSPVIGEAGRPIGVIAIVVETTARVQAETAMQVSEARLSFLDTLARETAASGDADAVMAITTKLLGSKLDAAICAYADMEDDQNHFTIRGDWSRDGAPSIVGHYSLADFGGLAVDQLSAGRPLIVNNCAEQLPPHDAATFLQIGIAATICMPLVKEGRLTALMAVHSAEPRTWTTTEIALAGEVTERCWAHIERVRSEAVARESDNQFRTFAQAMPNHVWTAQPDGNLDWFNDQVYNFSGAKPGELDGDKWAGIVHPEDVGEAAEDWQAALASGARYETEFRLRRKDGKWRWHLARALPIRDTRGKILRWIGTNTDVDEQKNAEAVLEDRLAERTEALAKAAEALQQVQKMEAIGNLTGGIAHDFNNLLMAVLGSLELLRKRMPQDPSLLGLVDNAVEGAERGASLTARMLSFARRQELKTDRIDLSSLVTDMTELLTRSLGPSITVETRFAEGLPLVEADPNQLESALLNLAVNARDAMDGEGKIIIAGKEEQVGDGDSRLAPGSYVCLSVADTGSGMDEATLKRALEPFFTTKGVGKGTGLGLSMVHGFAEQSNGTLLLKSAQVGGTTAEIWLPAMDMTALVDDEVLADDEPRSVVPADGELTSRSLKILAVDDDALVLMNTVAMLEDMGHDVTEAHSGGQALKYLQDGIFDLLITDHAMPKMTGAQLMEEARALRPELPIILATGYAELPASVGATIPRLSKPFWQDQLEDAVAVAMAR